MRYLIAVLVMGLLSACSLGATSPTEQPLPSVGASADHSVAPSMDAGASGDASPSDDMTAMGCDEAWSVIDGAQLSSVADLEAIATELEATLRDCGTLDDWTTGANATLPNLDLTAVEAWAATRCSTDSTLGQTPVCTEISG